MTSSDYELCSDGRFSIRDYNRKKPFSNFLPGIAGLYGVPMWVFYVNRGQGIASFGTKNKDGAILEFFPANKAYQNSTILGFRTFIKFKTPSKHFYEPFKESPLAHDPAEQAMEISSHEFAVRETNRSVGLQVTARYFTVPNEPLAALVRELTLRNLSGGGLEFELLDGLPQVNPYGMNEFFVKNMSRTIEAWMVAENVERKKAPFLRLKVDASDKPEVIAIREGNFFFSLLEERGGRTKLLDPIVDSGKIFGSLLDYSFPKLFFENTPFKVPADQVTENKTPCAFSLASLKLAPGQSKRIFSFFGKTDNVEDVNRYAARAGRKGYADAKREENRRLIESIKSRTFTATAEPAYDLYCGQTYLDNVMRGGLPIHLGNGESDVLFHVYSRKHGDLERDYNRFLVEPAYFSQGDGNYRDVNQNRRHDVWFDPRVKDANIRTFLNLIQLDGFNPLVIKGVHFHLKMTGEAKKCLLRYFGKKNASEVERFLADGFSPGEFYRMLEKKSLVTRAGFGKLLSELAPFITRHEQAEHGEGFWVDHWTYNLDLVESYLAIYPEDVQPLLFERREYTFYDNDHRVLPRDEKFLLSRTGAIRQYRSVAKDPEKSALLQRWGREAAWVCTRFGKGEIYRTTLFVKLLCLLTNKLASLDAEGIGIEMEADKPSWYDSLNGLPGLLGSSIPETFELKRLMFFMMQAIEDLSLDPGFRLELPEELYEFIRKMDALLVKHFKDKSVSRNFRFWDAAGHLKEKYRSLTRRGVSGREKKILLSEIKVYLERGREKVDMGLERGFDVGKRMLSTYFQNEMTRYRPIGNSLVRAVEFRQKPLPLFLEGAVHALKVEKDPASRRAILRAVRSSGLFDPKLGMFKVNASLEAASLEVGRSRVFTPGWLENESVWLHMEYKFLLEILKSGMDEEFFKDFRKMLIPFQPAERYGRSILENSSFIVSSVFPDPSLHGAGFVARLSGSTAEFLSMWLIMNAGKKPFSLGHDKRLTLRFEPHLPVTLFLKEEAERSFVDAGGETVKVKVPKNGLAFMFLGKTLVVYQNPKRLDTFGKLRVSPKKIMLRNSGGSPIAEFKGDTVTMPYAARVRDGAIPRIDIELG